MSNNCIFCKIVAGTLPCTKIYEDDDLLAFMDIGPVVKGHSLVIPKKHYNTIEDTPEIVLQKLIVVVKKIACAQKRALNADGINVSQANGQTAGQVVPHLHFHIIPRFETDGHHWNWVAREYDSDDEMRAFAAKIRTSIKDH